jgi:hypothetical protein
MTIISNPLTDLMARLLVDLEAVISDRSSGGTAIASDVPCRQSTVFFRCDATIWARTTSRCSVKREYPAWRSRIAR